MIRKLPHWVLTNRNPAFYDMESVTAIEMVAKLYGKMEEMINDYNTFVDNVNQEIENFENDINSNFNCFKNNIIKIMNDYIETIDTKINIQDEKIEEAINYMKANIIETTNNLFREALNNGDIIAELNVSYDSETEELTFSITGGENNE